MRALKIFSLVGLLTTLFLLVDGLRFAGLCRHYGRLTQLGSGQIPLPVEGNEAVVVLTGDRGRIPRALELLESRKSNWLVISGVRQGTKLEELLNIQGGTIGSIPRIWSKIIVESGSTSTIENAIETARVLEGKNIRRIILVTSDYHLPRAQAIFNRWLGNTEIVPYAVASEVTQWTWSGAIPALVKFTFEYWKWVLYRMEIF